MVRRLTLEAGAGQNWQAGILGEFRILFRPQAIVKASFLRTFNDLGVLAFSAETDAIKNHQWVHPRNVPSGALSSHRRQNQSLPPVEGSTTGTRHHGAADKG